MSGTVLSIEESLYRARMRALMLDLIGALNAHQLMLVDIHLGQREEFTRHMSEAAASISSALTQVADMIEGRA